MASGISLNEKVAWNITPQISSKIVAIIVSELNFFGIELSPESKPKGKLEYSVSFPQSYGSLRYSIVLREA